MINRLTAGCQKIGKIEHENYQGGKQIGTEKVRSRGQERNEEVIKYKRSEFGGRKINVKDKVSAIQSNASVQEYQAFMQP